MKESMGTIPIIELSIALLLVFVGIMCLTINHSKAFAMKDEVINIIERYPDEIGNAQGDNELSDKVAQEIRDYLTENGYHITGNCNANYTGDEEFVGYDRNLNKISGSGDNALFCIRRVDVKNYYYEDAESKCKTSSCVVVNGDYPLMYYYEVKVFYHLDIPIVNSLFNLYLKGATKVMYGDK